MKKTELLLLIICLLIGFGQTVSAEETEETQDEWTVLFYMCGSDLESKYAYASSDLDEIGQVVYADSLQPIRNGQYGTELSPDKLKDMPGVNVLIETGGSQEWHALNLGMEIRSDALQRWRFKPTSIYKQTNQTGQEEEKSPFELLETLPLESMADGKTLTDFITWGVRTCPAKKYALVLWDHGGGAKTGLFIDEQFDGDIMYLDELKEALKTSGVVMETLLIDACLMANIETAWAVKDSAKWLVASEEIVPGKGTAMQSWLQELFRNPVCDGKQLGRVICDTTQILYSNQDDMRARSMLTWSVIDLSRVERLGMLADKLFQQFGEVYKYDPWLMLIYADVFLQAEEYGDGSQDMRDMAAIIYHPAVYDYLDRELRNELVNAFSDTVVYTVRGTGRSAARGLSFCYATQFTPEEMEIYANNCPCPHYLAFLDAVTEWTAPEWVYEKAERLPELETVEELQITLEKKFTLEGIPALAIKGLGNVTGNVYYRLYRKDPETGQTVLLGRTPCEVTVDDDVNFVWYANDPMTWPSIDGVPCDMELVLESLREDGEIVEYLYNIPVQIGTEVSFLRCGRVSDLYDESISYQIYGVWDGYDEHTEMTNRNVRSLAQVAGQDYRILYPVDSGGSNDRQTYRLSETLTMYRALSVKEKPLPEGTYYLEYEVDDLFMRPTVLERIEMHWDGKTLTFPENLVWKD